MALLNPLQHPFPVLAYEQGERQEGGDGQHNGDHKAPRNDGVIDPVQAPWQGVVQGGPQVNQRVCCKE